ncbi:MAG: MazG family protein [Oscillospiraceae bacterium]|nr:MazG family protein [Oscillospiraceae bacterium]
MQKRNFYDLCDIIEKLRAPGGCPWDREQTHQSLRKHMIEEAYEAAEAFDSGVPTKMADELGDVLLQVVLHAQIGKESGEFTIDDVTEAVCEKMVVRHPHIFGSVSAETSEQVLSNWEEIKRRERGGQSVSDSMESVSKALPILTRSEKIYKKATKAGCTTLPEDDSPGRALFEEMTRLVDRGLDPEEEIGKYLNKFINFFKKFEENT